MERDDSKIIEINGVDKNLSRTELTEEINKKHDDNDRKVDDTANNVNNPGKLTYGISKDDYTREKSKKGLYIIVFIGVLAVGVIAVIFGKMSNNNKVQEQPISTPVATPTNFVLIPTPVLTDKPIDSITDTTEQLLSDLSKDIYNPIMGSEIYEIKDYIIQVKISTDKTHSVLLSDEGKLLYYCIEKASPIEISSACTDIIQVSDNGVFYRDSEDNVHRYMFFKGTDIVLGAYKDCCFSSENLNVAFVKDNEIYLLTQTFDEIKKIGKSNYYDCKVRYVSNDGSLVYWSEYYYNTKNEFIYEYRDGATSKILEIHNSRDSMSVSVHSVINTDKSARCTIIHNPVAYEIYVLSNDIFQYELDNVVTSEFYSKNGVLWEDDENYEGFFVGTRNGGSWSALPTYTSISSQTLLFFNQYGKKFEIKQGIKDFVIKDGDIYYTDYYLRLYKAKLQGYKPLSDEDAELIDNNVTEILDELCTKDTIYYLKNSKTEKYILPGGISVTGGISSSAFLEGSIWMYKSTSGKKIITDNGFVPSLISLMEFDDIPYDIKNKLYFKNVEYLSSIGEYIGDLYFLSDGKDAEKIASKVVVSSLEGGHNTKDYSDIFILYHRYSEYDSIGEKSEWYQYSRDGLQLMIRNTIK